MSEEKRLAGNNELKYPGKKIKGSYVDLEGERFYKIENYYAMPSFFMTIISPSDLWMFISGNGALTAGRKNPDHAIFPYYTDDKITDSPEITGSKSIFWIKIKQKKYLWEPFSERYEHIYSIQRNLYKNIPGNKILFEEFNEDLNITFQYSWMNSDRFGFIRKSKMINHNSFEILVELLDGIQNILPYGTKRVMQNQYSTLLDAYKKNELLPDTGIGIYYLSSIPTDMAEPSEGLKASVVYSHGIDDPVRLISSVQLSAFRSGKRISQEKNIRAQRGAYFIHKQIPIESSALVQWYIIIDTDKDICDIRELETLVQDSQLQDKLEQSIAENTEELVKLVAGSDGLQLTGSENIYRRHFSNVIFNIMRGGIFDDGYNVDVKDFIRHLKHFSLPVFTRQNKFRESLNNTVKYNGLLERAEKAGDNDLFRIAMEYLPLTFSRRHGDPSRPWNLFSIETKNPDGSRKLYYQGNWRDIFQNWEALSMSYPGFTESIIIRFLNASTADGYNPYRITRDGFEWERPDPNDPWSNIGYWGDHQIIYVLKLMELSVKFHPNRLMDLLDKEIFVYARIPYKIKPYKSLLNDPRNTILFDTQEDEEILKQVKITGEDGKLLHDKEDKVVKINMVEKVMVSLMAKLANFIPGGGIWMNTQRPEWNDANNALVGYGVSMVTVYYLRRYVSFWHKVISDCRIRKFDFSVEVYGLFCRMLNILRENESSTRNPVSGKQQKTILDALGSAASEYRNIIYTDGISGLKAHAETNELLEFFTLIIKFFDHTIETNKRDDGLYHAYNLMQFEDTGNIHIQRLYEMLEGQVAVLSSAKLNTEEVITLLDALRNSKLYRQDQKSYLLYPDRHLPKFMEKNNIPEEMVENSILLKQLLKSGDTSVIKKDVNGKYHFNSEFRNVNDLREALSKLNENFPGITQEDKDLAEEIYENVFHHQSFTGRSGTFFGYEGLGCIYWHMVSKLLLVVAENITHGHDAGANAKMLEKLKKHYYEVKEGIGAEKTPEQYGAFPADPYSHTPGMTGVQQPGMTGQVKEDILVRFMELGVSIKDGILSFKPFLLKEQEFLREPKIFEYYDLNGMKKGIDIPAGSLAFTFCQVPVIYQLSDKQVIEITNRNGEREVLPGNALTVEISNHIFERSDKIRMIKVYLIYNSHNL